MPLSISSFGSDAPSGDDLEYDAVFTDLMLAARPEEERVMGSTVVEAQEPDARKILELSQTVLARSHDLRAAILYSYAALRVKGFAAFAEGTTYLRICLQEYWPTCHPQLDADDDDDPTMRINAVLGLVDSAMMLRAVRKAPLTHSKAFGLMSLNDLAVADGETSPPAGMDNPPDPARISAAFQDTADETLAEILAATRTALADIEAVNAIFDDKTPGQGPDLTPLIKMLRKAVGRLSEEVGVAEDAHEAAPGEDAAAGDSAPAARASPGEIRSSRDVEQAIDRIITYYQKSEPSSPVPLILTRAKRLVGADFMTIVTDLAPGGKDNVKLVGGVEDE